MTVLPPADTAPRVTPAPPGHDLFLTIECTSGPHERVGTTHRVVVHSDWSVETPHNFEAERAARSMGGWCTCLYFAETVVPAYRAALRIIAGSTSAEVRSTLSPAGVAALCAGRGWAVDAPDAAAKPLAAAVLSAAGGRWARWGDPRYIDDSEASYGTLWRLGVTVPEVETLARHIPATAWPMPAIFYEAALSGSIDADWLIGAANCFPTHDFVVWAASRGPRLRTPVDSLWRMLDLGLDAEDAMRFIEAGVPLSALVTLAANVGVGGAPAAGWLALWWSLGVAPDDVHFELLARERVLAQRPPSWRLAWTSRSLGKFGAQAPPRTELAVMLALTTDLDLIEGAIAIGIHAATDIRFIHLIHQRSSNQ